MTTPPPAADNDSALVAAARRGEPGAMDRLLRAHQQRVYRVCLRMLSNPDDAAEVSQDALVKVIESLADFRGEARFSTWITRIAMNQSITRLRRRRVRDAVSLDAPSPNRARACDGAGGRDQASALRLHLAETREPDPASRVEREDEVRAVIEALAELEAGYRAVLVLRDVEQMDYQGIGEALELPVGTVKSRLCRARLALRHELIRRRERQGGAGASKPSASPDPSARAEGDARSQGSAHG